MIRRIILATMVLLATLALCPESFGRAGASDRAPWPEGTVSLPFENLEGVVLVKARALSSASRDTAGPFVLDTGAGYLALDRSLANWLAIADSSSTDPIATADRPLARFQLGDWEQDALSPVLTFDADVARRVADRPVLGLLGQSLFRDRVVVLDYAAGRLELVPSTPSAPDSDAIPDSRRSLGALLGPRAVPVRFQLVGDGKIVIHAALGGARPGTRTPLTLIVDTGSSKTVLFAHALAAAVPESRRWRSLGGITAPTLLGDAGARMTRVPLLRIVHASDAANDVTAQPGTDAAVIDSPLAEVLANDINQPVLGLLGYSYLRRFRIAIDYPRRVLWLDPRADGGAERPFEYTHVGLQLERRETGIVVAGVAERSPAARAGIRAGDVLTELDGRSVASSDLLAISLRLEGPAGTVTRLALRRGGRVMSYRLARQRLL